MSGLKTTLGGESAISYWSTGAYRQDALRSKELRPIFAISSAWLFYRMKEKKASGVSWSNILFTPHGDSDQKKSALA
jgi:hypothetical protein